MPPMGHVRPRQLRTEWQRRTYPLWLGVFTLKKSRAVAGLAVTGIMMVVLAPFAGAEKAAKTVDGTTSSRLNILSLRLTEVPALGSVGADLGLATGDATTLDRPVATISLEGLKVGDQSLGSHSVSSDDGAEPTEVTVPLDAPGINGALTLAVLGASATSDSATSVLRGLEGTLGLGPLGLTTELGGQGITSHVDPSVSESKVGVDIGPIGLQLGDLLPEELLSALPLSVLVDLAGTLDLSIEQLLQDLMDTLDDANATVDEIQATATSLTQAESDLDALIAADPQVNAARQQVAAAAAALDAARASLVQEQQEAAALSDQLATVQQQLAACTVGCAVLQSQVSALTTQLQGAQQDVVTAQTAVTAAESALQSAQGALDTALQTASAAIQAANDLVDRLQAELDTLLSTLETLLGSLPDLDALLQDVLDALRGAPILSIGRLQLGVSAVADASKGTTGVTCSAGGVSILGNQLGGVSCADLRDQFGALSDGIFGALEGLPVIGALPKPSVNGLIIDQDASPQANQNGRTSARASISALSFSIPSVSLGAVVDQVVADLLQQLEDLAASTPLASTLDQVVATVTQQLAALPTGALLAGLKTVGIDASLGGIEANSNLTNAANTAQPIPGTDVEATDEPQGRAPLALTGSGQVLLALALALWSIVAGFAVLSMRQKRPVSPSPR